MSCQESSQTSGHNLSALVPIFPTDS